MWGQVSGINSFIILQLSTHCNARGTQGPMHLIIPDICFEDFMLVSYSSKGTIDRESDRDRERVQH